MRYSITDISYHECTADYRATTVEFNHVICDGHRGTSIVDVDIAQISNMSGTGRASGGMTDPRFSEMRPYPIEVQQKRTVVTQSTVWIVLLQCATYKPLTLKPYSQTCPVIVAQRQSIRIYVERSRVRNSFVPCGCFLRHGNQSALLGGQVRW